ncbi:type IV toxin-antitoxin system AbiEi family antitoxin domain-containing protein [Georgenia subflava]|uniref:DUF559 domain-containing protein n=1 Tax=Georgenia subflava TaxID=1622177 RepID=A0A6N7ELS1_9MICO|nr:hypothetical protein [Georgenia subflava]MPV38058.1 hypothetical protein [Georgenia subflava]
MATANLPGIERIAGGQDQAITRQQLLEHGATPNWISRQVRNRRWQRVFRGVYVIHTGPLQWRTRARAALLYLGEGAALSHISAAFHHGLRDRPGRVIHVSVPSNRRPAPQRGLVIHLRDAMPPAWGRLRAISPVSTVLDLADDPSVHEDDVVGLVCALARRSIPLSALMKELRARKRVRHRALLKDLVTAVKLGVESPLEYRYHRVEHSHGLPRSTLQVREVLDELWLRADCRYLKLGVRVELDGQLAHPNGRTDADVWRDNAALIGAVEITLRYRWHHLVVTPCEVARQVALALIARGWTGRPRRCSPGCAVGDLADPPAGSRR